MSKSKKTTRQLQYEVARRVLKTIQTMDPPCMDNAGKVMDVYNAAFRSAGLPEIFDHADLVVLINGDLMTAEMFQKTTQELLSVLDMNIEDGKTTINEAIRKSGMTEAQVGALVEKHVSGKKDH